MQPFMKDLIGQSIPLVFHMHNASESRVLVQPFGQHPIHPDNQAGVELLMQIPPGVPILLQPSPLDLRTQHDTMGAIQHFDNHQQLAGVWNKHFRDFFLPHAEENRRNDSMFAWHHGLEADSTPATLLEPAPEPILRVSGNYNPPQHDIWPGCILAFHPEPNSDDLFWLGSVLSISRTKVWVQWLQVDKKDRYNLTQGEEHQDQVPMAAILAYNIKLKNNRLTKKVKAQIIDSLVMDPEMSSPTKKRKKHIERERQKVAKKQKKHSGKGKEKEKEKEKEKAAKTTKKRVKDKVKKKQQKHIEKEKETEK